MGTQLVGRAPGAPASASRRRRVVRPGPARPTVSRPGPRRSRVPAEGLAGIRTPASSPARLTEGELGACPLERVRYVRMETERLGERLLEAVARKEGAAAGGCGQRPGVAGGCRLVGNLLAQLLGSVLPTRTDMGLDHAGVPATPARGTIASVQIEACEPVSVTACLSDVFLPECSQDECRERVEIDDLGAGMRDLGAPSACPRASSKRPRPASTCASAVSAKLSKPRMPVARPSSSASLAVRYTSPAAEAKLEMGAGPEGEWEEAGSAEGAEGRDDERQVPSSSPARDPRPRRSSRPLPGASSAGDLPARTPRCRPVEPRMHDRFRRSE